MKHMRLGFNLTMQQTQKLIMTPELRQAIKLLQFNSQELWEYIDTQIEVNPLLEVEADRRDERIDSLENNNDKVDWKEYISQYDSGSYSGYKYNKDKDYSFENFVSTEQSLKDYLLFQLDLSIFNEFDKEIGELIIESLDNNGYLNNSIENIATQLDTSINQVESVLEVIQTFDPIGVGSRSLKECLLIQLKERNIQDIDVYSIVEDYLQHIADNKLMKIAKELDVDIKTVQKACDIIKSLEPKPGRGFYNNDDVKFVTPDVVLENIDGEDMIIVNDVTAPRLKINNFYRQMLNQYNDNNVSNFINGKLNSAMWLIKSIEQRRMTLYNVVESIMKFQKDFFENGTKFLKPLTLKEVADDIGMHESTVSRATNGKYIQTPQGTFELKYFFSSGVSGQDGGVSATSIKSMIEDLIDKENPKKPLSDQKIANIFKERNIKISRRTVAKYRDELNIPSSSRRRRY